MARYAGDSVASFVLAGVAGAALALALALWLAMARVVRTALQPVGAVATSA